MPATARAPTSNGASAIRPCGASVTLKTATTIAAAAGHNRRVAIAFSTSIQAASAPNAISGSGRSPLLNGSHAARNTAPAVHTATRLFARPLLPGPNRASTQRLMISQVPIAAAVAGSRIHTPAVLIDASCASTALVPVERRLCRAEEAVVVGGVARVGRRDRQVIAVVGRGRADECHSSKVPTTPMSTIHVDRPTRQNRRHA